MASFVAPKVAGRTLLLVALALSGCAPSSVPSVTPATTLATTPTSTTGGANATAASLLAQLQSIHTNVLLTAQAGAQQPVPEGQNRGLTAGDKVDVSDDGEAQIDFPGDALVVNVFRTTSLQLTSTVDPNASGALQFRLLGGSVFNTVDPSKLASQLVSVTTEDGVVIQATGTKFFVYQDPQTDTAWTVVTQGKTRVSAQGTTVDVPQGYQTWVDKGQGPQGAVPASRAMVQNKFPDVGTITGGRLTDGQVLTAGGGTGGSPTSTSRPTVVPTPTATASVVYTPTATIRPTLAAPTATAATRITATPTAALRITPTPTRTATPTPTLARIAAAP
ncbi:MAG: hypothetical protein JO023_08925 [Chloroflexi bacterium]|nr:hypothetical protein [Chloroflexota bacterium]